MPFIGAHVARSRGRLADRKAGLAELSRLEQAMRADKQLVGKVAKSREDAFERYREEEEAVARALKLNDTDHSGALDEGEVGTMLKEYEYRATGGLRAPTEDEVDCLICLCDQNSNGQLEKREIRNVLRTWLAYLEKKDETMEKLKKFDANQTGQIDQGELRPLLQEMNDGEEIPDEVLAWVWKQGDLTGDGSLDPVELTRAIACWYAWVPEEQPGGTPGMLAENLDKAAMPPPKEPTFWESVFPAAGFAAKDGARKTKKSSICAVL